VSEVGEGGIFTAHRPMFPPDQDGIGKKSIRRAVRGFEDERLDTKLADIEGIQLLKKLEETDPEMRRVIVTGYPTLENVIQASNLGADAYLASQTRQAGGDPRDCEETTRGAR